MYQLIHGRRQQHRSMVQVATLNTTLSFIADLRWDSVVLNDVNVRYSVVECPYNVSAALWEMTVKFVMRQAQHEWNLKKLVETFVARSVTSKFTLENANTTYGDGWYGLSTDLRADDLTDRRTAAPFNLYTTSENNDQDTTAVDA